MPDPVPVPSSCRLRMSGVHKRFGATHALKGVDLKLAAGEVLALVGENGAGKSTLMKVLSGAIRPDAGRMELDQQPYAPRRPWDARQSGLAMIYQELSLAPHLTVADNILLGVEPRRGWWLDRRAAHQQARQALEEIGAAQLPIDAPVRLLSIAQQQQVEIARAVATQCRVVVFDEPTSSLTRRDIDGLFRLIRRLRDRGIGVIYISHFLEEVKEISDRFTVLRDGEAVGSGVTRDTDMREVIRFMVGRAVQDLYPRSSRRTGGEVVLDVRQLSGRAKPLSASLQLRRGAVLGIAGLVGAGRTELLRVLFGLDPLRRGTVRVAQYTGRATPRRRWEQGVGMLSEDRKQEGLALGLSVADNITLSHLRGLGPRGFVAPHQQRGAAQRWIDQLSIRCLGPQQAVHSLSGGNQQKIAFARLLHADVDLLLLDEPTRGVDVGAKALLYQWIHDLAQGDASQGIPAKAVLMVSSYLPELLGVCDEIAVMTRGHLGPARPVAEWDEHQLMAAAVGYEQQG